MHMTSQQVPARGGYLTDIDNACQDIRPCLARSPSSQDVPEAQVFGPHDRTPHSNYAHVPRPAVRLGLIRLEGVVGVHFHA
jgi:hypothetical protein